MIERIWRRAVLAHLLKPALLLAERRGHGKIHAPATKQRLGIGIKSPCQSSAAVQARGRKGGDELTLIARGLQPPVAVICRRAGEQGRTQRHSRTRGYQRHAARIELEPGDGLDAAGDVFRAVGDGACARRAGIGAARHFEQYAAVFAPLLALQPFQHPLVAERLHVVPHAVENVLHEGVAPVQRAQEAPEHVLQRVAVLQVQQLVQYHLFVRRALRRHRQHGAENAADEGRFQPRHGHRRAGPQAVFPRCRRNGRLRLRPRRRAAPQQRTQSRIAQDVPGQREQHPGGVGDEQPVRRARRRGVDPGQDMAQPYGLERTAVGRAEPQLHGALQRLHPQRKRRDDAARGGGRQQRPQRQHGPYAVLPARRELVAQQPLDKQQRRRHDGHRQRLIEELPYIPHALHLHLVEQAAQPRGLLAGDVRLLQKSGYQVARRTVIHPF